MTNVKYERPGRPPIETIGIIFPLVDGNLTTKAIAHYTYNCKKISKKVSENIVGHIKNC